MKPTYAITIKCSCGHVYHENTGKFIGVMDMPGIKPLLLFNCPKCDSTNSLQVIDARKSLKK